jgi:ribonuclease HI
MKRGSEIAGSPRAERNRVAEPQPEAAEEEQVDEEPEDGPAKELMELNVVFDGGSRGNPGQGYGSYLVQSPGRKPVIKRVEFGDNYTNNQAEYDTLIAALQYIIERLTATGRTPHQVALDIKTDSDLVVNQLQGSYKVKDAGLKHRYAQTNELLEQFGAWLITWHPRDESVRLLGH